MSRIGPVSWRKALTAWNGLAFALLWIAVPLCAQTRIEVPRADGRTTPLEVYDPGAKASTCAPLAVISHGAGGSEEGYGYLARALAGEGYTAIVMGHQESG